MIFLSFQKFWDKKFYPHTSILRSTVWKGVNITIGLLFLYKKSKFSSLRKGITFAAAGNKPNLFNLAGGELSRLTKSTTCNVDKNDRVWDPSKMEHNGTSHVCWLDIHAHGRRYLPIMTPPNLLLTANRNRFVTQERDWRLNVHSWRRGPEGGGCQLCTHFK